MCVRNPERKIKLTLAGLDGNAFSLIGAFSKQARKEGWSQEDITVVINDAMSKDYNHLLNVLQSHCK